MDARVRAIKNAKAQHGFGWSTHVSARLCSVCGLDDPMPSENYQNPEPFSEHRSPRKYSSRTTTPVKALEGGQGTRRPSLRQDAAGAPGKRRPQEAEGDGATRPERRGAGATAALRAAVDSTGARHLARTPGAAGAGAP